MNTTLTPPRLPDNAPFSKEQINWLNGFLAGMYPYHPDGIECSVDASVLPAKTVAVLWGSQTGSAESLAKQVVKALKASGFAPKAIDANDYDCSQLVSEERLLVLTSTYGEGEPPDNIAAFHSFLLGSDAPRLDKTRYSVLALGDTNYPDFCKCGIEIDEGLKRLGARQLVPRMDCDVEFEEPFEQWLKSVTKAFLGEGRTEGAPESEGEIDCLKATDTASAYGKKNPFPAKISLNRNLNGDGSAKETRHVEISIEESGLDYAVGDALAVIPENCTLYVGELLEIAGLQGDELVKLSTGEVLCLREVLEKQRDVSKLSLKLAKAYAELSKNETLTKLVADRDAFKQYAWGREFIDLLIDYPTEFESAEQLLSILPKLSPRLYSISSSPNAHAGEAHVTVGVVRYQSHGRERKGVCSSYLGEHDGQNKVGVYFHHTKTFKLPEDDNCPVIMVGPGTGIAPFRAFLEERASRKAEGKNWLFFGDQHASVDFLYKDEIESYFEKGILTRLDTAFSRDQAEKIYVQDRMSEHGKQLYEWLEAGACFYVCGDASRMAKDVDRTLHEIIAKYSGNGKSFAIDYIKSLKKEKRYLRDVY